MTNYHRHSYPPIGPSAPILSDCAYPDGHPGPCDNPHAVLLLDPARPETLKPLQAALDAQPHIGLRSLARAVESLLGSAVA